MTGPPIRVAFCIDNMNPGGTELNALRTAPHLRAAGVELSVFSLSDHGPLLERYAALGVQVDLLPLRNLYGRSALIAGYEMRRIIKERGIDIVHAQDFYSNIFAGPWALSAGARFIASRRWWKGSHSAILRVANRWSYSLAHKVVANSRMVGQMLVDEERLPQSKVAVVSNFLDDVAFEPPPSGWIDAFAADLAIPEARQVIGCLANLSAVKDHGILLRGFANLVPSHPQLYLVLVGADGGVRRELQTLVSQLVISERVRFAGFLPTHPSPHHFFDISVLTSRSEGLPNSLLEAMAAGRPVVATAVGGVPEIVREGLTGHLVPPGDVAQLSRALERLLCDEGARVEMGRRARDLARLHYSVAGVLDHLIAIYRGAADHSGD